MPAWAMFFFWICVMSVGNFFAYVPIRTFTTHADMVTSAQALHASPWLIALVLGVPFTVAIWHFFAWVLPDAEAYLFPESLLSQRFLVALSAFLVFVFFGSSGIRNYGSTSHWLSVFSEFILFPVVSIVCWLRVKQGVLTK